jgi:hypothetical protein
MTVTFKGLSKNGKAAIYTGGKTTIRFSLLSFPDKQAPETIELPDGVFAEAAVKEPKVKMTAEERKAARAARPKPTLAERAEAARLRAEKLAAQAAKEAAETQPEL